MYQLTVGFCKCTLKYGYLSNFTLIKDILSVEIKYYGKRSPKTPITVYTKRKRTLLDCGHNYIQIPYVRTECFKRTLIY